MARPKNKFLPSIFEEKQDEKIQDFRKALKITEDEEENVDLEVRTGMHEGEGADEKNLREQQGTRSRASTGKFKALVRSLSELRMDNTSSWRSRRQGSAFVGGNRIKSGIPSGNRAFGYGQRKITSPGVNRARAIDVPDVVDLTNPEEVKNIAKRFFEEELKMDLSDPRFHKPEDFIKSLRWKAERKFSYEELWHRGRNSLQPSALMNNLEIFQNTPNVMKNKKALINKNGQGDVFEKLPSFPQLESKYFQVCYSKPRTGGDGNIEKKKLTTSFKEPSESGPRRRRGRILNPIRWDVKKSKKALRWRGQAQERTLKQKQLEEKN